MGNQNVEICPKIVSDFFHKIKKKCYNKWRKSLGGSHMKLMNTTNSHATLVKSQLESTDATLVEVYSAGNTDVIFTKAPTHYELLISNKHRAIRETEVEKIREFFLKRKIDLQIIDQSAIKTLYSDKLIEISFPII